MLWECLMRESTCLIHHFGGIRITKGLNLNNDLVVSGGLLGLTEDVNVPARLVCKVNRLVIHPQRSIVRRI
jgi:hypothetical protein